MRFIFFILIALITKHSRCQNLVPNSSFEDYSVCPNNWSQIGYATNWFVPTWGTPDYYNACCLNDSSNDLDYYPAMSGNGMAGIYYCTDVQHDYSVNYREYLSVKLTSPLVPNTKYYVTFYAKLAPGCKYAGKLLSMYLTKDSIFDSIYGPINRVPQINSSMSSYLYDKMNWTKILGSFVSDGTEKYAYIGNFRNSIANDTLYMSNGNISSPFAIAPYYFIDNVCISTDYYYCHNWTGIEEHSKTINHYYPNPFDREFIVEGLDERNFILLNTDGNIVLKTKIIAGKNEINTESLKPGLYIAQCGEGNEAVRFRVVKAE